MELFKYLKFSEKENVKTCDLNEVVTQTIMDYLRIVFRNHSIKPSRSLLNAAQTGEVIHGKELLQISKYDCNIR